MGTCDPDPTQGLHGRESLRPVFQALNAYTATTHFNGQSTVAVAGPGLLEASA